MSDAELKIPEIPANLSAQQVEALHLEFARLGLVIANDAKNRQSSADIAVAARHREQLDAAQKRHEAANPPFLLGDLAAALAARADPEVTVEQLDRVARKRWEWLQGFMAEAAPVAAELDAEWYLAELTDEFTGHVPPWPATLDGARKHWDLYGKIQGRRGRAGGPGWGPKAKDAPPGVQL
jgi:hypothetical protein